MWTQPPQSPSDSNLRRRQGRLARQPFGSVSRLVWSTGSWLTEKHRALCMSPNGTYIGGYPTRIQSSPTIEERTAVFWSGTTMTPLFSEPTLLLGRSGEVRAVNDSGEFVGSRLLLKSVGRFIPKAFRSETNGKAVGPGEYLVHPFQSGTIQSDIPSVALSISQRVGQFSGVAVGWVG